jgi:hypothetical protein
MSDHGYEDDFDPEDDAFPDSEDERWWIRELAEADEADNWSR